jgi:hypothetical protein
MNSKRFLAIAVLALLVALFSAAVAYAGLVQSEQLSMPEADGTGWSSGWVDIAPGQVVTLTHNLGADPALYSVDLWFRDADAGGLGINHRGFGGIEAGGHFYGAVWKRLTASQIEVERLADDTFADQILVRMWTPDPPVYDSGWQNIAVGHNLVLTHNLGGNVDDYTVGMKFNDLRPQGAGINLVAAGGFEIAGQIRGAAWSNLTDTTVNVLRFANDPFAGQVRIFIYRADPPDYDSGWASIAPGETITLPHGLRFLPTAYVVRMSARGTTWGDNAMYVGGYEVGGQYFGSNWQGLTRTGIEVFRQPDDGVVHTADEVRVRIWVNTFDLYLPLVGRGV